MVSIGLYSNLIDICKIEIRYMVYEYHFQRISESKTYTLSIKDQGNTSSKKGYPEMRQARAVCTCSCTVCGD